MSPIKNPSQIKDLSAIMSLSERSADNTFTQANQVRQGPNDWTSHKYMDPCVFNWDITTNFNLHWDQLQCRLKNQKGIRFISRHKFAV